METRIVHFSCSPSHSLKLSEMLDQVMKMGGGLEVREISAEPSFQKSEQLQIQISAPSQPQLEMILVHIRQYFISLPDLLRIDSPG